MARPHKIRSSADLAMDCGLSLCGQTPRSVSDYRPSCSRIDRLTIRSYSWKDTVYHFSPRCATGGGRLTSRLSR